MQKFKTEITAARGAAHDSTLYIKNEKGVEIQPHMYGLFFEDINYAADGGLYAEMIENLSFEAFLSNGNGGISLDGLYGGSAYPAGGTNGLELMGEGGLNANNTHYLRTSVAVKNKAYDGIYMKAGEEYRVSLFARGNAALCVRVFSGGVAAEAVIAEALTEEWTKYTAVLRPQRTVRHADFVIEVKGTADIDMVSCMPSDAVMGIFRRDIAEKIKALQPGFLRFPGGCIAEGYDLANRYNWKDSVGKTEERRHNWSRWSCHVNEGADNGFKHYNQTYGMGYYEYFLLCEYLGCAPLPVVNAGMACQYQTAEVVPLFAEDGKSYTEEFKEYIQDALDLIEFANGSTDTRWGGLRAAMGHPKPFGLTVMGIGNEQWVTENNLWFERYEAFENAIHKAYPDMKLISTSGPEASGAEFDSAWAWARNAAKTNDSFAYAVDEHYYRPPEWFLANTTRYDDYDRAVKVFAGEYASQGNKLYNAIAEAAFLTGFERNADVVYMASYAPLLAREGYVQWAPDMIWFDDVMCYVTPNYHVQRMYSVNTGCHTLKSRIEGEGIYQTVSRDTKTGDVIIKLANIAENDISLKIELDGINGLAAEGETLTGADYDAENSVSEPDNIKAYSYTLDAAENGGVYTIPARSFSVLRLHTK